MIRRLQRKFIAAAMLALLIVLGLLIGLINVLNYRSLVAEADETLQAISELDGTFPMQLEPGDPASFEKTGRTERRRFSGERMFQSRYFSVEIQNSGEIGAIDLKNVATVSEKTAVKMAESAQRRGRKSGFSDGYRYVGIEEESGTRWIFLNREPELETFRSFLWTSCGIALAGAAMVFLLLALFSSRIIRPIAQSYEKQKQFITDAGHELKTPITIIRADADVVSEDLPENEWLTDIRTQTDRLSALTNDLIYLSRMEEEGAKPQLMDFSLSDVVQDSAQPFSAIARTHDKTFTTDIQPMLTLHGDERSIRKLVSILLENAMKYSPEQGRIHLSLKKTGKQIRLTVFNTAENVEKGSADRLFDRFYRADASRNSETGGFGLGLAIAKAVVETNRGKIHAYSADGQSLTVEAIFAE